MRTKKKSKLRNAEYYDIQQEFDELYKKSKKNCKFTDLLSIITSEENIKLAYRNIKKNHGSKTAGTDGKTIRDLEKWQTEKLINHIRKKLEYYKPQAIRRVEIPKPNGKKRPLGIPTIMDRLIQQCIYQILEPIAEAKFHERSNGFRPNRSTENAIAQVYKMVQTQQLYYLVDIDIKAFFENVQHGKLLKQMWQMGIQDKKLLKIISVMLKAEVADIGFPEKGTPQGGIISPLLSNIVLHYLMRNPIENQSVEYNDNRLSLYCAMQGKCAITKTILEKDNIHCHHVIPRKDGGGDNYQNLLLIDKRVHILLHATRVETIEKYLEILNLNKAQLNKLNAYRAILNLTAIETKFSL